MTFDKSVKTRILVVVSFLVVSSQSMAETIECPGERTVTGTYLFNIAGPTYRTPGIDGPPKATTERPLGQWSPKGSRLPTSPTGANGKTPKSIYAETRGYAISAAFEALSIGTDLIICPSSCNRTVAYNPANLESANDGAMYYADSDTIYASMSVSETIKCIAKSP